MYSTCTVTPEENEENTLWVAQNFDFELVSLKESVQEILKNEVAEKGFLQLYPGVHSCDGFFLAKFRRKER